LLKQDIDNTLLTRPLEVRKHVDKGRNRVTNGNALFIEGDQRSKAAKRFRDIISAITADLGGGDRLSEGQKQLIRRCSLISVECEKLESRSVAGEAIDLELFGTLTDRLGRTLQRIGLKRVPKLVETPSLSDYLAGEAEHDGPESSETTIDAEVQQRSNEP
jgi:hypothetical protein